jgi:uncharacterized protein YbaA (DUF1428 family)
MEKQNIGYVDGYVLVVKKDQSEAYRKMADEASESWIRYGALAVRECRGNDLTPDMGGKLLQFPGIMNAGLGDEVRFSYIEYASKEDRDRVNALVHKEMSEKYSEDGTHGEGMPFDMEKMTFGGFTALVSK